MPLRNSAAALAICVFAIAASAQTQQTCITPPVDSPILAPTLDTIPPGAFTILTHTGARAEVPANGRMAVVEINDNEQRVWFGPDASPGVGRVYYNRRYRADAASPWYWQYGKSIIVMSLGNTSAGPNSVLYSATAKYRNHNQAGHPLYKYIMYAVSQPSACDAKTLGILHVSYSNDGVCWTPLVPARRPGAPTVECAGIDEGIPVETIAAIDGGSTIYFLEIEGEVAPLADLAQMDRTAAYLSSAAPLDPATVRKLDYADVTAGGIVGPESPDTTNNWYKPYNYLMNLDMTYDPATGTIYMARAYPFPFDRSGTLNVPCPWQAQQTLMWDSVRQAYSQVGGCYTTPATLPNRVQIYKKSIGPLSNIRYLYAGSWTLVADLGGDVGYTSAAFGSCAANGTPYTPRTDPRQQDAGRDYAYVNFVRDAAGNLKLYDGLPYILAGDSFKKSKSRGGCYITGLERETLVSFPR